MPIVGSSLFSPVYKNVDGTVLNDKSAVQYNGYIDDLGGVNVRPGETLAYNAGRRIDGLYCWPEKFIVSVEEGNIVLYNANFGGLQIAYNAGSIGVPGLPSMFCNDANYTFIASGGSIWYVDSAGVLTQMADPDAPTAATHVIFLDGYILANNQDGTIRYANSNDPTTWASLSFFSPEGNPDKVIAVHEFERQMYFFGTVSVEIWEDDGDTPFSRIPGGLIPVGCSAPYSVVADDNGLMWLSDRKYFVRFAGDKVENISSPYDKDIQDYDVVSDCKSGRVDVDGRTYCLFAFPSAGHTLAYEIKSKEWSEWGRWDDSGMTWLPYDMNCLTYDKNGTGKTFVGKTTAKLISMLDKDSRLDCTVGASTERVKFLRRTGHMSYGTLKKKRSEVLAFRLKSGDAAAVGTPTFMLRYRNNGSSQWSNIKELSLGATGNNEFYKEIRRSGIYRTRQYELSATEPVSIVMAEAEEEITVLLR